MTTETFCIYCQQEFKTPRRLVNHIKEAHRKTYAFFNLVPEGEQ